MSIFQDSLEIVHTNLCLSPGDILSSEEPIFICRIPRKTIFILGEMSMIKSGIPPAYPFPKWQILDSSKLKEFADDNFKFDENDRKVSRWLENTVGKGEIAHYEQFLLFPQCFQKTNVLQTRKNQGLFGKGLSITCQENKLMGMQK